MKVIFIYIDDCKICRKMKLNIQKAISKVKEDVEIIDINSDTDNAINLGIKYGIEDIPSCIIGNKVLYSQEASVKKIIEIMSEQILLCHNRGNKM